MAREKPDYRTTLEQLNSLYPGRELLTLEEMNTEEELERNARYLLEEYRQTIVCETYISGKEYNVALLYDGEKSTAIGTVEVVRKDGTEIGVFGAEDKSTSTCTKIPAVLPEKTERSLCDAAVKLHRFIGCLDYMIQEGRDLLTVFTCTYPNTHRFMVICERITEGDRKQWNPILLPLVAMP